MQDILMMRGHGSSQAFIVKDEGKYYLVNPFASKCSLADPPELPDMFLKQGWFEDAEVTDELRALIIAVLHEFKTSK